jgi:putative membrane protein
MVIYSLVAFLHFAAAFGVFATLVCEWLIFRPNLSHAEARTIQMCDLWYGIFAASVLLVGFARVLYFEKGRDFYFHSPFFWIKVILFAAVVLISIYPTAQFIGWRGQTRRGMAPIISAADCNRIELALKSRLLLLLGLLLSASLMARGVGL